MSEFIEFIVSRYIDKVVRIEDWKTTKQSARNNHEQYDYFRTEQEAKDHIVLRAHAALMTADRAYRQAMRRYNRVLKKFGQKPG